MPKPISIQGDEITRFLTYDQYLQRSAALKLGPYEHVVVVASDGTICQITQDFMYARDNGLFPLTAYRLQRCTTAE